eukprot:scaffold67937_cov17-Tisochrysis_lutea.AAC.1
MGARVCIPIISRKLASENYSDQDSKSCYVIKTSRWAAPGYHCRGHVLVAAACLASMACACV